MNNNFDIRVFNVGQGDHNLLSFADGSWGIIDCFYDTNLQSELPALKYIKDLLSAKQKVHIRFIHISHFDSDHIKGLKDLLKFIIKYNIEVDSMWLPFAVEFEAFNHIIIDSEKGRDLFAKIQELNKTQESKRLTSLFKLIKDKFILKDKIKRIHGNRLIIKIAGIENFDVWGLTPDPTEALKYSIMELLDDRRNDRNLVSSALQFEYFGHKFIFGGDALIDTWNWTIQQNQYDSSFLKSDFIKASHHGAENAANESIWMAILKDGKSFVAFSAGNHPGWQHPRQATIDQLKKAKPETLQFSTNGKILDYVDEICSIGKGENIFDKSVTETLRQISSPIEYSSMIHSFKFESDRKNIRVVMYYF